MMWKKVQKSELKMDIGVLAIVILLLLIARILTLDKNQAVVLPLRGNYSIPTICYFKNIFGINCPSCGLTRSLILWMHGDFRAAWELHRLSIFIMVLMLIQIPYRLFILICQKRIALFSERRWLLPASTIFIVAFIGNWIYNLFF